MVEPIEAYNLIRAACLRRSDLRFNSLPDGWERINLRPYEGFCYIASHAFSHLTGAEVWVSENHSHYWNKIDGKIWDLTAEQFDYMFPYLAGHRIPRKNKNKLPARVKELLNECNR